MKYQIILEKTVEIEIEADSKNEALKRVFSLNNQGEFKYQWDNSRVDYCHCDELDNDELDNDELDNDELDNDELDNDD